jgi:hypothetical protein
MSEEAAMFPMPKCVFLTCGIGISRQKLTAFEYALRAADIAWNHRKSITKPARPRSPTRL